MTEKWTPGPWSTKWSKYLENTFIVQAGASMLYSPKLLKRKSNY